MCSAVPQTESEYNTFNGVTDICTGRLIVADTNNNTIRYITLSDKGAEVKTLELIGVQPPSPKPKALKRLRRRLSADTDVIDVDGGSSKEGLLSIAVTVPDGYHFSKVIITRRYCFFLILLCKFASFMIVRDGTTFNNGCINIFSLRCRKLAVNLMWKQSRLMQSRLNQQTVF